MKELLLSLKNICYAYEDTPFALRDVSANLYRGERIVVLGSNGAGKSTFFMLLNGVLPPDSGTLLYRGIPVDIRKRQALLQLRQRVGIVFQDPNQQIVGSTVAGEVSFGPMNLRLPKGEVARRVEKAVAAMALAPYAETPPHYLSGGEKKRVTIADILAMESEIILFDEPTASLDCTGVRIFEDQLAQLAQQGKTLVISTHDVDFAWRWASRILIFSQGVLMADRAPAEVFSDDGLLRAAGLRKPYLYAVSQYLQSQKIWPENRWANSMADLTADTLPQPHGSAINAQN